MSVWYFFFISLGFGDVNWGISDGTEVVTPPGGTTISATVVTSPPWGSSVLPSHYSQLDFYGAVFIGIDNEGDDDGIAGSFIYKKHLGVFDETLSQATIWMCGDDRVKVGIKWGESPIIWSFDPLVRYGSTNHMYEVVRSDFTDLFNTYDYASVCTLVIKVRNLEHDHTGLKYFYTIEDNNDETKYIYDMKVGVNHISMPYRIGDLGLSLEDIFPGATFASYFDERTRGWETLDISVPLTGNLGDICRSRSIAIVNTIPEWIVVKGYPIFEQHYIDFRYPEFLTPILGHGTVNCIVPFDYTIDEPEDIDDGFIVICNHAPTPSLDDWIPTPSLDDWIPTTSIDIFGTPRNEGYFSKIDDRNESGNLRLWCSPPVLLLSHNPIEYPTVTDSSITTSSECEPDRIPILDMPPVPYVDSLLGKASVTTVQNNQLSTTISPNPFNSTVEIILENIPNLDNNFLNIYDINGKLVKNFNIPPSKSFSILWDGTNNNNISIPSGVYIYTVNNYKQYSGRILLIK